MAIAIGGGYSANDVSATMSKTSLARRKFSSAAARRQLLFQRGSRRKHRAIISNQLINENGVMAGENIVEENG
jgi:hypothetical protein